MEGEEVILMMDANLDFLKWTRDDQPLGENSQDDGEGVLTVREISVGERGDYVCVAMADRFINIARVRVTVTGNVRTPYLL